MRYIRVSHLIRTHLLAAVIAMLASLVAARALAQPAEVPDSSGFHISVDAAYLYGPASGYLTHSIAAMVDYLRDVPGGFGFGRDVRGIFAVPPHNVFLVKLAYWLNY